MLSLPEFIPPLKEDFQVVAKKYQLFVYYGDSLYDDECYKRAEVSINTTRKTAPWTTEANLRVE